MNPVEFAQSWIEDLRTSDLQGKGKLFNPDTGKYCALGRAVELSFKEGGDDDRKVWEQTGTIRYPNGKSTTLLPRDLAGLLRLTPSGQKLLGYRTTEEDGKIVEHEGDIQYILSEPFQLPDGRVASVMGMNDSYDLTFMEIADVLERELLPYVRSFTVQGSEGQVDAV